MLLINYFLIRTVEELSQVSKTQMPLPLVIQCNSGSWQDNLRKKRANKVQVPVLQYLHLVCSNAFILVTDTQNICNKKETKTTAGIIIFCCWCSATHHSTSYQDLVLSFFTVRPSVHRNTHKNRT